MAFDHGRGVEELTVLGDMDDHLDDPFSTLGSSDEDVSSSCTDPPSVRTSGACDKFPVPTGPRPSSASGYRMRRSARYSGSSMHSTTNSSSQEEGEEEVRRERLLQRRKRRRRRRKISSREREKTKAATYAQKLAKIEAALLNSDRDALAQLAVSQGGLLSDEIRARVWPRLMGIHMVETDITVPTDEEIKMHPEYNQVVLDVNRSLKRFPPCIGEDERPALQEQLTRLIIRVIKAHPHLHYYQGYHDVAITFLLVVGEELGFQIVERLSISHLQQFMAPTMEQTVHLLQYMFPIIRQRSPELYQYLDKAELGTIFALPWLITWFGHVLPDYGDVVRLYDFFLAQPPLMPIYLAAAIVLHRKDEILQTDCDMASIHKLLSDIPDDLPFEKLLVDAQILFEEMPPHTVQNEVSGMNSGGVATGTFLTSLMVRIILYSTPVLLGILLLKYYPTQYAQS